MPKSAKGHHMGGIPRREFGRLASETGILGLTGTPAACGAQPAPPSSEPTKTATPVPDTRTRPIKLTQKDVDRIIGDHAHTLLDHLRAKTPGPNYGRRRKYPAHRTDNCHPAQRLLEKRQPSGTG